MAKRHGFPFGLGKSSNLAISSERLFFGGGYNSLGNFTFRDNQSLIRKGIPGLFYRRGASAKFRILAKYYWEDICFSIKRNTSAWYLAS